MPDSTFRPTMPRRRPAEPSDDEIRQTARFFDIDLRPTTQYLPDIDALKNSPSRVVVGIGADSGRLLTYRTSVALCELLGSTPVEFPGDHGGFLGAPTRVRRHPAPGAVGLVTAS